MVSDQPDTLILFFLRLEHSYTIVKGKSHWYLKIFGYCDLLFSHIYQPYCVNKSEQTNNTWGLNGEDTDNKDNDADGDDDMYIISPSLLLSQ